ncbi:cell division protein FtsZ [candidate division KSB1 bacterium]|nr:cell division protein FtsZ [candidate division KSB1 bacterium]
MVSTMANKIKTEIDKQLEAVLSSHKTKIRIVGTGGGGNNTVTRLVEVGISEVDVIAVNTDAQDLLYAKADHKVLIGKNITHGLGAGSDPQKGEDSAKENIEELEEVLSDSDMVFITCGLGGGTGTGSAPVIAEISKRCGALTIAVVTLPFSDEGVIRWENARKGLEQLQNNVDTVIVVQNDLLLDLVPDMPLNAAFKFADEILVNAVKGITELVTEKGLVNLDFADVKTIMQGGGLAMIGLGETDSQENIEEAAKKALENPLLDIDITGAKSALINITGGQDMSLKSAKTIMKTVAEQLDPSAKIIWGTRIDESMGQSLRVMLIVTCLKSGQPSTSGKETRPSFEISDETSSQDEAEEVQVVENSDTASQHPSKSQKVFSEIFMEETETDISVLEEAINNLAVESGENEKHLSDISTSASSIYSSSELFDYDKISEFAELLGEVTKDALNGKLNLSEDVIELFQQMPSALRSATKGDGKDLEEIKQSILKLLDSIIQSRDTDSAPDFESTDEEPEILNESEAQEEEVEDLEHTNVRETVKYFDKLL